jgi:hypothetical protein
MDNDLFLGKAHFSTSSLQDISIFNLKLQNWASNALQLSKRGKTQPQTGAKWFPM